MVGESARAIGASSDVNTNWRQRKREDQSPLEGQGLDGTETAPSPKGVRADKV